MSKIECPVHGVTYGSLVCNHIYNAIKENYFIEISQVKEKMFDDGSNFNYSYCKNCMIDFKLEENKIYEEITRAYTIPLVPICSKCFSAYIDNCKKC